MHKQRPTTEETARRRCWRQHERTNGDPESVEETPQQKQERETPKAEHTSRCVLMLTAFVTTKHCRFKRLIPGLLTGINNHEIYVFSHLVCLCKPCTTRVTST